MTSGLAEAMLNGVQIDEESLSPADLRFVIEHEPDYERRRTLVRTANEQVRAAEWLIDHSLESPMRDFTIEEASNASEAYYEIFHEFFPVLTGRHIID